MKKLTCILLAVILCAFAAAACAETGVAYNVYHMAGESPDSLIRATAEVEDGKLTAIHFDEKLLPVSFGGAEGWAELPKDATVSGALTLNNKLFPSAFLLDGLKWTIAEDMTVSNEEKGEFIAYITTEEGGDWYFAQEKADLLDAEGHVALTVEIGTKASIEHGVHFWVSPITFPGNIAAIEEFLVNNGVDFTQDQISQNGDGFWGVADAVSGATLAGTPNYFLLAQEAYANAIEK
ncbi:MAG: hypothetical protein IJ189_04280 [Clostridia bacterium]|nr:hypothetical protein [Clostridia bacterium]